MDPTLWPLLAVRRAPAFRPMGAHETIQPNGSRMNTTRPRIAALAALALAWTLALAGCRTTPTVHFHPEEVRARITDLCEQHKYQEAREVKVKAYPSDHPQSGNPSPEELVKQELVATLVNPSEAAWRTVGALESLLDATLDNGHAEDEEVQRAWRLLFRAKDLMERKDWAGATDVADRGLELLGADPVAPSFLNGGLAGDGAGQGAWQMLSHAKDLMMGRQDLAGAAGVAGRGLELFGAAPAATPSPSSGGAQGLPSLPNQAMPSSFSPTSLSETPFLKGVYQVVTP